jgi:hypothetical protein
MKSRRVLVLVLCSLSAFAAWQPLAAQPPAVYTGPIVLYVQTGAFVANPPVLELTIYGSGEAFLSRSGAGRRPVKLCQANDPAHAAALAAQLDAAQAFFLADDPGSTLPDVAAVVLTYLVPRGGGRARANTFSYGPLAQGQYLEAENAVRAFITQVFPHC